MRSLRHRLAPCFALAALLSLPLGCGRHSSYPLSINEVLPSNHKGCADSAGERNDWVELYNGGSEAIDLGGFSMTDDTASPTKSVFPNGLTIAAGGVLLLWADKSPDQGPTHLKFKLGSTGEEVVLYDPDRKLVDQFRWTNADTDVSYARIPDGTGEFVRCGRPTCGAPNGSACAE